MMMQSKALYHYLTLVPLLQEIASMRIGQRTVGVLQSSINKSNLLTKAVGDMQCIAKSMTDPCRRMQVWCAQMVADCDASRLGANISFQCLQSTSCSWEKALADVVDNLSSTAYLHGPMPYSDILSCGQLLRSTNALPLTALLDHCGKLSALHTAAANVLLQHLCKDG